MGQTRGPGRSFNQLAGTSLDRLAGISDGIFAVGMTLLVLGLARLMRGRILIAQSLYAFATALCFVFPTWVSIALIVLIQLNYVIAPRIPILRRF